MSNAAPPIPTTSKALKTDQMTFLAAERFGAWVPVCRLWLCRLWLWEIGPEREGLVVCCCGSACGESACGGGAVCWEGGGTKAGGGACGIE